MTRLPWLLAAALLATAGGAGAAGVFGGSGSQGGIDLQPAAEGCLCYGTGYGYDLNADGAGHVHLDAGHGAWLGHATPAGPPLAEVGGGRWVRVHGNAFEGRAEARTDGGASLNAPFHQFAGQDAMVRFDPGRGLHAEAHDNAGGTLQQHVGWCGNLGPGPGNQGTQLYTYLAGYAPFPDGAGLGPCYFET